MREDEIYPFDITENSLMLITGIQQTMEGSTFHKHTHILYDIRTKLGNKRITYLEIGSYAGASVSLISSHIYPTDCFSVDIGYPIDPEVVKRNVERFKNKDSNFEYICGSSYDYDILKIVKNKVKSIDLLFIDGDHSEYAVYQDFKNYSQLVSPGGYICFDDYMDPEFSPGVKVAVDNIVKNINKNFYEIIGCVSYDILKNFTDLNSNSTFIIKKL